MSDYSDKEYYELIKPIVDSNKKYFIEECLINYLAHYISSFNDNDLLKEASLDNVINSALNIISNTKIKDCNINKIKNILKKNYHLNIINDNPIIINKN